MLKRTQWLGPVLWMALAVMTLGVACGDDPPPAGTSPDGTNNDPNNDAPNNDVATARLEHVSPQTVALTANSRVDLTVRYVGVDGSPQSNQTIGWTIIGNGEGSSLEAQQSTTDGSGQATIRVLSSSLEANFEVEAKASNDPGVAAIRFAVSVESKDFASYRVIVNYNGARRYTNNNIKVSLYETPDNCADFNPLRPGTAFRSEKRRPDAQGFPMNFTFTNLQNGTRYTAVAVAFAAESDAVEVIGSSGCNDSRPEISNGNNPDPITIDMLDVMPELGGQWAVTSRFNLSEALPPNVTNILNPILDFFVDPEGTLVTLLVDFLNDQFGFDIGSIQSVLEAIAEDLLESAIDANETVRDVLTGAGDIAEIIRNFHLEGTIIIPAEAIAPNGLITGATIRYTNFGYRWRLNCESPEEFEMNPACGDAFVPFGDAGLVPIEGTFDGAITPNMNFDPNTGRIWFHELTINDHVLDFNYGQIVAFIIEKIALPLIFRDENLDSLNEVLRRFISCEDLFDSNTFVSICETAIDEVSNVLRAQLTELSFSSNNFTVGTPSEMPCALYEQGDDEYGSPEPPNLAHLPKFKNMGKDQPDDNLGDLRCRWNAQIQFSPDPQDRTQFTGQWFGVKRFDN